MSPLLVNRLQFVTSFALFGASAGIVYWAFTEPKEIIELNLERSQIARPRIGKSSSKSTVKDEDFKTIWSLKLQEPPATPKNKTQVNQSNKQPEVRKPPPPKGPNVELVNTFYSSGSKLAVFRNKQTKEVLRCFEGDSILSGKVTWIGENEVHVNVKQHKFKYKLLGQSSGNGTKK